MTLVEVFKMNCRNATLLAQKRSEGRIGLMERFGLWLHFVRCSLCRLFFEQSELISHHATQLDKTEVTLGTAKKAAMKTALNEKLKG